ncbi:MAG: type II secretion system protein [Candidatus Riflebacteria bacterium]|nr:type II secretion system protein [Candidatus Riflebacteria bacterium]
MIVKNKKRAITFIELMVSMLIIALIATYAWKIYSNSGETMRHTVSQSQIQADIRSFLDNLEAEMMTCYSFNEIDSEKKMFSFYSFTYSKMSLDDIMYDGTSLRSIGADSDAAIKVLKIEYSWADGIVTKKRTPGLLYFYQRPMTFKEDTSNNTLSEKALTKEELKDISDFEVKGYTQTIERDKDTDSLELKITPVTPQTASSAVFIALRIHALKDETGKRRDEEIDIVTKFYSSVKLAEITNPTYFSSTDNNGNF